MYPNGPGAQQPAAPPSGLPWPQQGYPTPPPPPRRNSNMILWIVSAITVVVVAAVVTVVLVTQNSDSKGTAQSTKPNINQLTTSMLVEKSKFPAVDKGQFRGPQLDQGNKNDYGRNPTIDPAVVVVVAVIELRAAKLAYRPRDFSTSIDVVSWLMFGLVDCAVLLLSLFWVTRTTVTTGRDDDDGDCADDPRGRVGIPSRGGDRRVTLLHGLRMAAPLAVARLDRSDTRCLHYSRGPPSGDHRSPGLVPNGSPIRHRPPRQDLSGLPGFQPTFATSVLPRVPEKPTPGEALMSTSCNACLAS